MSTLPTPPQLRTEETAPVPAPAPQPSGYLVCQFCECKLTRTGEVYNVSDKARDFRDNKEKHGKAVTALDEQISALKKQLADKDAEIASLKGSGSSTKRSFL